VGGQEGVELALGLLQAEIERGMTLMGCANIGQLSRDNLRFRSFGSEDPISPFRL
jgi:L-lactate dehydrogenase (cytochrome)